MNELSKFVYKTLYQSSITSDRRNISIFTSHKCNKNLDIKNENQTVTNIR